MTYIKGIDVSSIQGNIDWNKVAASGVQFVIIKCCQGNDGVDPRFSSYLAGAKVAGLKTAIYHFVYPLPTSAAHPGRDAVSQAQAHFAASKGELAFCDLEWPEQKDWKAWGCTPAQINQWVIDYLATYSSLSGRPMPVYTYPNFAETVKLSLELAQYPLWIASYEPLPTIPKPWSDWAVWQNTGGGGHLPSGAPVDTDVVRDFSLWNSLVIDQTSTIDPIVSEPDPSVTPIVVPTPNIVVSPNNYSNIFSSIINFFSNLFK